jgi:hypothetical protein
VSSLVRPEFGPTLPTLLRERFGLPPRATIAAVAVLVALGAVVAIAVRPGTPGDTSYVHESEPVFNMLSTSGLLDRVEPQGAELVRFEGERGPQRVSVTVRPLELPATGGDVSHALLPVYASAHEDTLREEIPGFELVEEGRARVGTSPGYEVTFRSGSELFGSDVMVVPGEDDPRGAVLVSLRREVDGKLGEAAQELSAAARSTYRSFAFGRDRPDY